MTRIPLLLLLGIVAALPAFASQHAPLDAGMLLMNPNLDMLSAKPLGPQVQLAQAAPEPPPGPPPGDAGPLPQGAHGGRQGPPGPPPNEPGESEEDIRTAIENVMMARLSRELELNDEQTVKLVRRYHALRDEIRSLDDTRDDVARDLKKAIEANEAEATLQAKLDALLQHDQKVLDAKLRAYSELGEGMNTAQRAKLYLFVRDFEWRIRRMIYKAREEQRGNWQQRQGHGAPGQPMPQGGPGGPGRGDGRFTGPPPHQGAPGQFPQGPPPPGGPSAP